MTPQEIFDTVSAHMFTQGVAARKEEGGCLYRLGELKCAVGALIPDNMYTPLMDDAGEVSVLVSEAERGNFQIPDYFKDNIELLSNLQAAHDNAHNWGATAFMKERLMRVARYHELDTKVLDNLFFNGK